jgi:hypothetical protein
VTDPGPDVSFGESAIHGRGAFAGRRLEAGERVWTLTGRRSSIPRLAVRVALGRCRMDDPLQIGRFRYLELDEGRSRSTTRATRTSG